MEIILHFFFPPHSTKVSGASLRAQFVNHLPAMQETQVQFLSQEDPLEKGMATHSSILAWGIPWTEESDRLRSTGLQESGTTTKPPLPLPWSLILQSLYLVVPALQFFIAHIYLCLEIWLVLPFWSPFFPSFLYSFLLRSFYRVFTVNWALG